MKKLLTDEQMRTFLTQGFIALQPELPADFHAELRKQCAASLERDHGNPGNNILPLVPQLQELYASPVISGALTSVLGERYLMHPHRHMHSNSGSNGGAWHKDSYWGYTRRVRNHRPWWVMIMYYPQAVRTEDGPTGVIPGSQWHDHRQKDHEQNIDAVTGEAGTFFMIHYDIWHRATPNTSGITRQMLKFEFMRLDEPTAPTWNCAESEWQDPERLPELAHRGMYRQIWNFLSGKKRPADHATIPANANPAAAIAQLASNDPCERMKAADELERCGPAAEAAIGALAAQLADPFEPAALNAAYALAAIGARSIPALIQALRSEDLRTSQTAAYALSAMNGEAASALLDAFADGAPQTRTHALFALGEIRKTGADTVSLCARAMQDADPRMRLHAIEALGMKGPASKSAMPAIIAALRDDDTEIRFNAALTCARLGSHAAEAVPALAAALKDADRYVRGYAIEALDQIGSREAFNVLVPFLKSARWCTSTSPASNF